MDRIEPISWGIRTRGLALAKPDPGEIAIRAGAVRLRRFNGDDIEPLSALFADDEVTRYLALDAMRLEDARDFATEFVADSASEFAAQGCGAMAITADGLDNLVGYAGVRPLPDRTTALELMYAVAPASRGQGHATRAAAAILAWAFERFDSLAEVLAMARAENDASLAVLRRLGMRRCGVTERYYDCPLELFVMDRHDPTRGELERLTE